MLGTAQTDSETAGAALGALGGFGILMRSKWDIARFVEHPRTFLQPHTGATEDNHSNWWHGTLPIHL
jgi:hypothetical protein